MSFDDDFRMPDFDDDYEDEIPEDEDLEAEGGANRGFLIGVGVLSVILVIALCLVGFLIFRNQTQVPAVSETEMTNQANMTLFAETQTLGAAIEDEDELPTEGPDDEATEELPGDDGQAPDDEGTATPTSGLIEPDETEALTPEDGDVTPTFTDIPDDDGQGGGQPGIDTPTPRATSADLTPTIIEVTPIGGGEETATAEAEQTAVAGDDATATAEAQATEGVTPTEEATLAGDATPTPIGQPTEEATATEPAQPTVEVTATDEAEETPEPTGVGGPIDPTEGPGPTMEPGVTPTLPETGFTGGAGLAGAGLLAVVLMVVVIVARRVRLK